MATACATWPRWPRSTWISTTADPCGASSFNQVLPRGHHHPPLGLASVLGLRAKGKFSKGSFGIRCLIARQLGLYVGPDVARGPENTVVYLQVPGGQRLAMTPPIRDGRP